MHQKSLIYEDPRISVILFDKKTLLRESLTRALASQADDILVMASPCDIGGIDTASICDVVIVRLDSTAPGDPGVVDLITRILEVRPDLSIIVLSERRASFPALRPVWNNIRGIITHDDDLKTILWAIRTVHAGGTLA
ncbi:response regulator transcription factor [Azospirillum rugosum]|uniref:DNA-binding NarL/FixJ family response regulator n=1 Tax=Azospirillum rugosum TaxID=416170 RepID=A0ABS4SG25_9PROT|nr:response regulator transcription factor [Azospirillum rugosum]MBP2291447.1 DNA-binding NarL/FixJ family response regulator [Azospirillum rugosum]MDQ0525235.1 DNA-binding NarL/FixJ family response regulator [Azospirillum rugosum]